MLNLPLRIATASIALYPVAAFAHTGSHLQFDWIAGILHPLSGIDHVLAMLAVGVLAGAIGGRSLVLVPASFVALMAAGAALARFGVELPYAETGIALSVITMGALIASPRTLSRPAIATLVGVFALCHGQAHGLEAPASQSILAYGLGFLIATAALHAAGIGIAVVILSATRSAVVLRLLGVGLTIAGIVPFVALL